MTMEFNKHISVLKDEVVESMQIVANHVIVDCTIGRGGHTDAFFKANPNIKVIGIDKDLSAITFLNKKYENISNIKLIHNDFKNIKAILGSLNIKNIDRFVFDLGVSSPQFDDSSRGFSYHHDAKLDMRMDVTQDLSAYEVVNNYSLEQLVDIFKRYGETNEAKQVANAIVKARTLAPIETTLQLVDIIKNSVSKKTLALKKHPAKVFFQAIRIEVNHELEFLEQTILDCFSLLSDVGKILIITFHSLEDKLVKKTFNKIMEENNLPSYLPITNNKVIKCKCVYPKTQEVEQNNRARSAKLRILSKEINHE